MCRLSARRSLARRGWPYNWYRKGHLYRAGLDRANRYGSGYRGGSSRWGGSRTIENAGPRGRTARERIAFTGFCPLDFKLVVSIGIDSKSSRICIDNRSDIVGITPRRRTPRPNTQRVSIVVIEALIGLIIGIFVWRRWGNVVTKPNAKARWEKVKQLMPIEKTSSKNNANKRTRLRNAA